MLYWNDLKDAFDEIRIISDRDPKELVAFADSCRERLCEMLEDDGVLLLEQYICCLQLLSKGGEFHKNK